MRIKFQYADWAEWEGLPSEVHNSPDKGVIRMWVITDDDRRQEFVYDDFYYLYPQEDGWIVGSGTPKREFFYSPEFPWAKPYQRPVILPENAVVRKGQTVSQEEAVRFGLIDSTDQKKLHPKVEIPIERK